eukprot:5221727-Amphidinium_carterae.2
MRARESHADRDAVQRGGETLFSEAKTLVTYLNTYVITRLPKILCTKMSAPKVRFRTRRAKQVTLAHQHRDKIPCFAELVVWASCYRLKSYN